MSIYFDNQLQFPNPGEHSIICWHPLFPVLAVATDHPATRGTVDLFADEGDIVPEAIIRRNAAPSCLAWHPRRRILAAGWDSGEVLIWNDHERELFQMPELHSTVITALSWNSDGTKLLSGDTEGNVALWKADTKGRLQYTPIVKHNLGSSISTVILKPPDPSMDIKSLARAAVSGDESALDMFTWKKGKGSSKLGTLPGDVQGFFLGCDNGTVHYLHDNGKCTQRFAMQDSISKLLYYDEKGILVTVTRTMNLCQHSVNNDGECKQLMKVKLGGRSEKLDIIMVGRGLLASATGESVVRIWDFDKEENYVLSLDSLTAKAGETSLSLYERNIGITSISYQPFNETLVAGTTCGQIAVWVYDGRLRWERRHEPESQWQLQPPSRVDAPITHTEWQPITPLLAVNTGADVFILSEQHISYNYNNNISIVQNGPNYLSVNNYKRDVYQDVKTDLQIKGVVTTQEYISVWNGKKVLTYEYSEDGKDITSLGSIVSETKQVCLFEQNLYTMEKGRIQVRTPQGTVKQTLIFTELEGDPVSMDVCGSFFVVGTNGGFVKLYDISRREAKQVSNPKHLPDVLPGFGQIESVRCNCSGTRVSIIAKTVHGGPDPKLYVWDVEVGSLMFFNLESGRAEQDDFDAGDAGTEDYITMEERGKNQAAKDIAGRYPASHFWDQREAKLLVCEAKLLRESLLDSSVPKGVHTQSTSVMEESVETMIVSLFATSENGVLLQDNFALSATHSKLIGSEVPHYYFIKKPEEVKAEVGDAPGLQSPRVEESQPRAKLVARRTMRDFVGLESSDKTTTDAMMNFSYYLAIGNMDEAFRSIKLIKNESVWENMAKMCVKSRRLDVAAVCLGNMGHARGAKALREARSLPELDAQVAVLAVQLGLIDDAERLLKNCGRYDLLNDVYQSSGQWTKAIDIADSFDRVNLRRTHYNYAKHLESRGEINAAIPIYEKSETHRFEVPRMLFDEPLSLEAYIVKTKDQALHKWWAQYMESAGEMESALQFYEAAQDYLSLVRVYCYCSNLDKAAEICNETGDAAGCYHLARQYENQEHPKEAIHFFTRAQAYGNAIRLCKDHGMDDQLMNLALLGKPEDMLEAARFYESKPEYQDKAVMLYHKADNVGKALELAFSSRQFGALQHISESLDSRADPELLRRCAIFFMENSQFDKAVDLLATGKKYKEALKVCLEENVTMTEDLAEKLTPEKDDVDNETRMNVLNGIAEVCMQQRQYHLATKKYTQSGNKLQAMKALLKSGDTEKIIFFAGVSRQKEIYVMAANYLQSLDWRKEPDIMKNIIGFYTKGRALDSLSSFYDACAQVEIDEYQNYEKAMGALGESFKCLSKAKLPNQSLHEEKLSEIKRRMELIKKFVHARSVYEEDADEAMKMCQILLEEADVNAAVRVGDVFGFMTEHFARKEKWRSAYSCIEELQRRTPKVNLSYYINPKTISAIYKALNMATPYEKSFLNGLKDDGNLEGEVVDEDVVDEFIGEP